MPPPVKNYQRIALWQCSFAARPKLRNYTFSDKDTLLTDHVALTLQFPLTASGWKRLQDKLEIQHPNYGFIRLLAATPLQEEFENATN